MRVRVSFQHPTWPLMRQTPRGSGVWEGISFGSGPDATECDWWVVAEGVLRKERAACPPNRTILVTWEPPCRLQPYAPEFLAQFAHVLTCHPDLPHPRVQQGLQGHPWFVERSYDELREPLATPKLPLLSIVTSDKAVTEGHRRRLRLAHALKDHLGDRAVLWGRGIRDFDDKWDVLAPYQFTLALENDRGPEVMTEKLPDCFLAETLPFYDGCTNTEEYFPAGSFVRLGAEDLEGSVRIVERVLDDPGSYERALPALREAKRRYLEELQFFPLLAGVLRRLSAEEPAEPRRSITVVPEFPPEPLVRRGMRRLARLARGR